MSIKIPEIFFYKTGKKSSAYIFFFLINRAHSSPSSEQNVHSNFQKLNLCLIHNFTENLSAIQKARNCGKFQAKQTFRPSPFFCSSSAKDKQNSILHSFLKNQIQGLFKKKYGTWYKTNIQQEYEFQPHKMPFIDNELFYMY